MNAKLSLLKPGSERSQQLAALVREINSREDTIQQLKDRARNRVNQWLSEVICQGSDLNKAKAMVPHGDWSLWLESHCPLISQETARRYMLVAANSTRVLNSGVDSLREALKLCADNSGKGNESGETKSFPGWLTVVNGFGKWRDKFLTEFAEIPSEGKEKLKEDLLPVAQSLWPERFA